MAEQIPFSIVEKIIIKLASASFQEIVSIYHADDELEKLKETVSTIKAVLLDAEKQKEESEAVQNWTKRLKRVLNQADDLLDDVLSQALKQKAYPRQVRKFFSTPNRIFFRREIASRIKDLRVRLGDIAKDMSGFNFTRTSITKSKHRETQSFVMESEIIGREESKDEIKKLLLQSSNTHENVSSVAIVGIGGLGKTTVAQLVYNDVEVANFFGKRMWVCVSDDFDVRLMVQRILECFTRQEVGNLSLNELGIQLRTHLSGTKYLLVLDDVWNDSYEKWKKLKDFVMVGAQGSKILVTTRNKTVASTMGIHFPYLLGVLTEQQSRDLFRNTAFQGIEGNCLIDVKEKIGDQIAVRCKGVPLAITSIAGMLRSKSEIAEWSQILNEEIWRLPQQDEDIMPVLRLSYSHLPIELRQCFAYCAIYPKDHIIVKEQLIQLWMAQGYLEVSNENKCLEDIGEEYVLSLVRRSFFQDIEKDEFGEIVSFKMHDLIHDLAASIAGSDCNFYQKSKKIAADTLHLSYQDVHVCLDDFPCAKGLRTFLSISESKGYRPPIYAAFRSLRALYTGPLLVLRIPESIVRLPHLRYLNLSHQFKIKSLPNSICDLVNLQTLKLDRCFCLEELPQGITKLVNLRCLTTDGCYALCMPSGIGKLTSLTRLPRFVVGNDSKSLKLQELNGLNNLRGDLWVENLSHVPDDVIASESSEANLKEKKGLRSLTISWEGRYCSVSFMDHDARNVNLQSEILENLEPHNGLQGLSIIRYPGLRLSSWLCSLTDLMILQLVNLKHCKQIPPLDRLPMLQKISIQEADALECIYYNIGSTMTFFPSLSKLLLYRCPKLIEWRPMQQQTQDQVGSKCENKIEKSMLPPAFPCLSELTIRDAPKLINMPLFPDILDLELFGCSLRPLVPTVMSLSEISSSDTAANTVHLEVQQSGSLRPYVPLSKLKRLRLRGIKDGEFHLAKDWLKNLHSLQDLTVVGDVAIQWEALATLQCLENLMIVNWQTLTGLPECFSDLKALGSLLIAKCPNFSSLPESLSNLQRLTISHVMNMGTVLNDIGNLTSLLDLALVDNDSCDLESLPDSILNLVNLQKLTITNFQNLNALPEWIGNFTSLCELSLSSCRKLASLPERMRHLTNLQSLSILYCPILTERCRKDTGQDWPKIAHIRNLTMF